MSDLIFIDGLPVARRSGIDRGGFEDGGRDTVRKRPVNDVTEEEFIMGSRKWNEGLTCDL